MSACDITARHPLRSGLRGERNVGMFP